MVKLAFGQWKSSANMYDALLVTDDEYSTIYYARFELYYKDSFIPLIQTWVPNTYIYQYSGCMVARGLMGKSSASYQ